MFQAGVYQIERTQNGESELYGYLEIVEQGSNQWELKFHGEGGSQWPLPAPTSDTTYAFSVSADGLPPQTGDGAMSTFDWEATAELGEPEEISPGPVELDIDAVSAFVAFVGGNAQETTGYYGVSNEFPDWPLPLEEGQTAVLSAGTAESPEGVVAEATNRYGEAWTRRGLQESF